MCGIVGMMDWGTGGIYQNKLGVFMQLLHANALRGMHGTGVFAVDNEGSNFRVRVGGPPHELVDSQEFDKMEKFINKKTVRFLVGHNRYKTTGDVSTQHSHPFRDDEILLVHNGTLDTYYHLPDSKKYKVDSEAVCHAFAVDGAEKTVPTLKGAWTFVWYDGNKKTLNFLRNKERPLFIARHDKDPYIVFASEEGMLKWVLNRNGTYLFDIKELPENQMFSYSLDSAKPHVKELKGKAEVQYVDNGWEAWGKNMREEAAGTGKSVVERDQKVIPFQQKSSLNSSIKGSITQNSGSVNRGSLPLSKTGGGGSSQSEKGYWVASDFIHDIGKGSWLNVTPIDWKAIDTDRAKEEGLYQVRALADDYPDVMFYCNVKGRAAVEIIMEAAEGMKAQVGSILRSMASVAKHPHQIYLHNPEPMFIPEPKKVPEYAHTDTH
jgi:glucosamine 6-phosphate synthetase-like amidotransferase/phosphosugar isomerase protein